jgi:hypothetical protein
VQGFPYHSGLLVDLRRSALIRRKVFGFGQLPGAKYQVPDLRSAGFSMKVNSDFGDSSNLYFLLAISRPDVLQIVLQYITKSAVSAGQRRPERSLRAS